MSHHRQGSVVVFLYIIIIDHLVYCLCIMVENYEVTYATTLPHSVARKCKNYILFIVHEYTSYKNSHH